MRYVGKSIKASEGLKVIKGETQYVDDISPSNVLYLHVVRSPLAHALIKSIDTSDALKKSLLVITQDDIRRAFQGGFLQAVEYPNANIVRMPTLAESKVKFVGQPVAAVIGRDRSEAEDLGDLVSVDYEPLEVVTDPEKALDSSSPIIHNGLGTNVCVSATLGGDTDAVFKEADFIVEDQLISNRVSPNPIEPRGIIVSWESNRLKVWVSSQGVFRLKQGLSDVMGLGEERIRVIQTDVGGAFGSKSPVYPEYVLACYASKVLKNPIKWIETRMEHLVATYHGRDVRARLSLAAKRDGTILGIRGRVLADIGAYNFFINANYAPFVSQQLTGPYSIKAATVETLSVFTNKTPIGPYRGAGRPEAAFFYERMMDLAAEELKMDPAEIRMKNLVRPEKMPYSNPLGLTLDPEDYPSILRRALNASDYEGMKMRAEADRNRGRLVGLGLGNYIELNRVSAGEGALVRLNRDGGVTVVTGLGPHGQGHGTMLAQLVADELDLDFESVEVIYGDSDLLPRGVGTFGSRSAVIGGAAAVQAARQLKKKIVEATSKLSETPVENLQYERGLIKQQSIGNIVMTLKDFALRAEGQEAFVFYEAKDIFSFGVHTALVEVDEETGHVNVMEYKAADDAGRVINPLLTEGQIMGGIIQGLGQVFYEDMIYGQDGQPLGAGIGDAGVPSAVEAINVESHLLEFPSSFPHGARGVGEAGTIGALPALVSAVDSAIDTRIRTTSIRPERVLKLLSQKKKEQLSPSKS